MKGISSLQEGKILFASGSPKESISYFNAALEQGADPVIVGLSKGTANMALQRYTDARDDFTLVINSDPQNERAYYYRGISHMLQYLIILLGEIGKGCHGNLYS